MVQNLIHRSVVLRKYQFHKDDRICDFIQREARGSNYVRFKLYSTNAGGYAIELSMTIRCMITRIVRVCV